MIHTIRNVWSRVADVVWPRSCPVLECARPSDRANRHICSCCFAKLPLLEAGGACSVCGMPIAERVAHTFVCDACKAEKPAYTCARAALRYVGPVPQLVKDFKYHKALHLTEDFADLMEAAVRAWFKSAQIDVLIPVPLNPYRLRERGYNQSEVLAAALAKRLQRRMDTTSLVRRYDTAHQARISGRARRTNLKGAFATTDSRFIRGRTLLLVDDVMTTGTTFSTCAKALKEAGAADVWCLALARALR